mmetsp:Transcript_27316/g.38502  ORF Transcript_27316/g.38502 Transcript_27316/m.38502 type:complete len:275 (+) Transcript_27316:92-916(+)
MTTPSVPSNHMNDVKHKILVLSGKGGVGKSTVSTNLALALVKAGKKVGLLDIDLCGPSIPRLVGLQGRDVKKCSEGWVPVYPDHTQQLAVMSIGFLLPDTDAAVIWRGPKKTAMIKQFVEDVCWGQLDYLIIDTPPGTSDEHLSIVQYLKNTTIDGAVIITTPQEVSLMDVRKEINFCKKVGVPIIGVVENMSGFVCPKCNKETKIFPPTTGGAQKMAKDMEVPFLGSIPIDPRIARACDEGKFYMDEFPESEATKSFNNVIDAILKSVDKDEP